MLAEFSVKTMTSQAATVSVDMFKVSFSIRQFSRIFSRRDFSLTHVIFRSINDEVSVTSSSSDVVASRSLLTRKMVLVNEVNELNELLLLLSCHANVSCRYSVRCLMSQITFRARICFALLFFKHEIN